MQHYSQIVQRVCTLVLFIIYGKGGEVELPDKARGATKSHNVRSVNLKCFIVHQCTYNA